jgi:hypothetical protein
MTSHQELKVSVVSLKCRSLDVLDAHANLVVPTV